MSHPSPATTEQRLAWGEGSLRLAQVVRTQQAQLQAVVDRLEASGAEDIHQGRVAARRLRSILKTFAPLLDARWARRYRDDLRDFARALGAARESDVLGSALESAVGDAEALSPAQLRRLALALRRARAASREGLREQMDEPAWRRRVKSLAARSEQSPQIVRTDASMADVLALVERAWRKPRKRLRRHPEEAAELHELRLRLKHCRYALEVVADVEAKSAAKLLRRLRRVQDAIGLHRDTVLAAQWVHSQERSLGPRAVQSLEALLVEHEPRLRRAAARQCEKLPAAYAAWASSTRRLARGRSPADA